MKYIELWDPIPQGLSYTGGKGRKMFPPVYYFRFFNILVTLVPRNSFFPKFLNIKIRRIGLIREEL